jgi:hypothetical protein
MSAVLLVRSESYGGPVVERVARVLDGSGAFSLASAFATLATRLATTSSKRVIVAYWELFTSF